MLDKKTYSEADLEEKLKQAEERLKVQDAEIELLKKFTAFLTSTSKKANKFNVIEDFINNDTYLNLTKTEIIKLLCSYLNVSVSGYYKFKKSKIVTTRKRIEDAHILEFISNQQNRHFRIGKTKFKKIGYRQMTGLINKSDQFEDPINHREFID